MILFDVSQNHPLVRTFVYIMSDVRKKKLVANGEDKGVVNKMYLESIQQEQSMSHGNFYFRDIFFLSFFINFIYHAPNQNISCFCSDSS